MDVKDSFVDLERHRLRLEENLVKLRQSLQHWQTWEAEYEGLKEEILAAGDKASITDLVAIGRDFGGTLVDEKEIKTLLGDGKNIQRTGRQVADLVTRRLDYVQRNIQTVETQIATAEEKLNSLLLIRQPEVRNEKGFPITEIREELDDDGNVICASTITRPGDVAPQVVEVLRKAGVTDIPSRANPKAKLGNVAEGSNTISRSFTEGSDPKQILIQTAEPSGTDGSEVSQKSLQTRGSEISAGAGHSEKNSETPAARDTSDSAGSADGVNASSTKDTPMISSQASPRGKVDRLTSSDIHGTSPTVEDTTVDDSPPVIPIDESPEDAALRRQMIQYGLHEVGAVVAELDLDDETESQHSYSDDDLGDDEQYTSSTDEEEDAFGRTTRRVIDDEYRKQMLELEKKLNVRGFGKSQPELHNKLAESNKMAVEQTSDKPLTPVLADKSQKSTVKKGVRFAEELDISPVPAPPPRSSSASEPTPPMQDLVVERATPSTGLFGMTSSMPKKTSRFKMAREAVQKHDQAPARAVHEAHISNGSLSGHIQERTSPSAAASSPLIPAIGSKRADFTAPIKASSEEAVRQSPDGPPGKTHVSNIIEREVSSNAVDAPDPDDMDPDLLQQEVAVEYHRMRNRMIQREGGFLPRDDQEERVPLTEEEGGSGKKISRFKAARLRGHA